ncbi:hypothetical protein F5Y03DRAFT_217767 [Xylaria venustula]|nr:hypothetical protein F5Y03DRAFT_217767 [Xylaria venustula]
MYPHNTSIHEGHSPGNIPILPWTSSVPCIAPHSNVPAHVQQHLTQTQDTRPPACTGITAQVSQHAARCPLILSNSRWVPSAEPDHRLPRLQKRSISIPSSPWISPLPHAPASLAATVPRAPRTTRLATGAAKAATLAASAPKAVVLLEVARAGPKSAISAVRSATSLATALMPTAVTRMVAVTVAVAATVEVKARLAILAAATDTCLANV